MASLSYSEAKFSERQGRAESFTELVRTRTPLQLVNGSESIVDTFIIDGTTYKFNESDILLKALNEKKPLFFQSNGNKLTLSAISKSNIMDDTTSKGFNARRCS